MAGNPTNKHMRRLYLRDCAAGDMVEDVFVLTNKQLAATTSGKFFIKTFCSDRTGQVTARIWNATREMFNTMPDGGFVRLRGRIENYQNNLQLIIEQMWPAKEGTFDVADLVPHTNRDIDAMVQRLFEVCGSIQNRHLSALIQSYLDDEDLMNNFCKAPAAMSFHHAFIGGLLEHTLNAMEVADAVCKFYPKLNRDLVLAGIFLHDIAKTWELSYDCAFGYTDGGHLVGHIVKSAMWVEDKAKKAEAMLGEKIPRALIDVVQHIILSHHGVPEFGAAKIPATPEAIAVHVIENLDAKLMMALQVTRGEPAAGEGNWTEYLKSFNGRLYRPDVAPAEAIVEEVVVETEFVPEGTAADPAMPSHAGNFPQAISSNGAGAPQPASQPASAQVSAQKPGAPQGSPQPVASLHAAHQHGAGLHSGPAHAPPQHAAPQHAPPQHAPPQHAPPQHGPPPHAPQHSPQHGSPQHAGAPNGGANQPLRNPAGQPPVRGGGPTPNGEPKKLEPAKLDTEKVDPAKIAITNPLFDRAPARKR
jgi:3'-5' exoribonuclease